MALARSTFSRFGVQPCALSWALTGLPRLLSYFTSSELISGVIINPLLPLCTKGLSVLAVDFKPDHGDNGSPTCAPEIAETSLKYDVCNPGFSRLCPERRTDFLRE